MKCLFCDHTFEAGDPDCYQFCDPCVNKLDLLGVDLDAAEDKLRRGLEAQT